MANLSPEIIVAILGGIGGLTWVGTVLVEKIKSKTSQELARLELDKKNMATLKEKLQSQEKIIINQNEEIAKLKTVISTMQTKINIIVPILRNLLKDNPDDSEILKHLEDINNEI